MPAAGATAVSISERAHCNPRGVQTRAAQTTRRGPAYLVLGRHAVAVVVIVPCVWNAVAVRVLGVGLEVVWHAVLVLIRQWLVRHAVAVDVILVLGRDAVAVVVGVLLVGRAVAVRVDLAALQVVRHAVTVSIRQRRVRLPVVIGVVLALGQRTVVVVVAVQVVRDTVAVRVGWAHVAIAVAVAVDLVLGRDAIAVVVGVLNVRNAVAVGVLGVGLEVIRHAVAVLVRQRVIWHAVLVGVVLLLGGDAIAVVVGVSLVGRAVAVRVPIVGLEVVRHAVLVRVRQRRVREAVLVGVVLLGGRDAVVIGVHPTACDKEQRVQQRVGHSNPDVQYRLNHSGAHTRTVACSTLSLTALAVLSRAVSAVPP